MNGKNFNPKNIIQKIVRRDQVAEEVQPRGYHEYPKKPRTEPRHMFSGEFPAVILNALTTPEECEACPC